MWSSNHNSFSRSVSYHVPQQFSHDGFLNVWANTRVISISVWVINSIEKWTWISELYLVCPFWFNDSSPVPECFGNFLIKSSYHCFWIFSEHSKVDNTKKKKKNIAWLCKSKGNIPFYHVAKIMRMILLNVLNLQKHKKKKEVSRTSAWNISGKEVPWTMYYNVFVLTFWEHY